jgi:hypothetical protein
MIHTIQAGTQPREASIIKADDARSLSATGSITFPRFDTRPNLLAK